MADTDPGLPGWQTRRPRLTPRISREAFDRTHQAYQDGLAFGLLPANSGSGRRTAIDYAAEQLGLNRETVRQRLAWAPWFLGQEVPGVPGYPNAYQQVPQSARTVEAGLDKRQGFRPPRLPPAELTPEQELDLAVAEFERRRQAELARRWMEYQVEGEAPFALVYMGDPHLDDPHTDLPRLRRDVGIINQTPRMWGVGLGDYVNGWRGKLTRKYADQRITERGAYVLAKWLFSQPFWWLLLQGNHDAWAGGGSPLEWMLEGTDVPLEHWDARFRVTAGAGAWTIWAAHNFPGTSQWNILHGPLKRAMMTGAVADLFVCGDHHTYGLLHTQHEHTGQPYWVARARGYKLQDPYSRQCGFGEMDMGHSIVAVHDPRTGKLQCFDDVETGAQYLRFLQEG